MSIYFVLGMKWTSLFFWKRFSVFIFLKRGYNFIFFSYREKTLKWRKLKMSVGHTCFLYPDQTLPAAPEGVPVPGPARSGAGDGVGFVWARELWVLRAAVGRWNCPWCSSQAFTCWGRGLGTEPLRLNQWRAHDWFCKEIKWEGYDSCF